MIRRTPLEAWIARKLGLSGGPLTKDLIESYQLQKLSETILYASMNSPFYKSKFSCIRHREIQSLADIAVFPLTTAADIAEKGLQFLCVSQDEISRVVTLDTSGTTGSPKRLYFTPSDQELTTDFFRHGMSTLVEEGDRVLILLPGERPGSVGDLLSVALKRFGVIPVPHGVVGDMDKALEVIRCKAINSIVGIPIQVLALARYSEYQGMDLHLKSVLLSTDNLSSAIVRELKRLWSCRVFDHYGMTEMGLGGGVECDAHAGYHMREADLYLEIVDDDGKPLPDGQYGEVVFTTLTRQGMPLIRYGTGDISRFIPERCKCGAVLRRMDKMSGRRNSRVSIGGDRQIGLTELDEVLFDLPGLIDFTVSMDISANTKIMYVKALTVCPVTEQIISSALDRIQTIRDARSSGTLKIIFEIERCIGLLPPFTGKRRILLVGSND
ncbi:MAG TPA: AMP-binding protein [Dissulfurispiraceae bacterium]|nr:AMP-binding protein [Dissulfurispiraceae bacterium]